MRVAVGQAFDLTRDEIWFLKALRAAGERGRIVSVPASRAALARLVEVQYVTTYPQSERRTLYVITDRGRQALANAPRLMTSFPQGVTPGNFGLSARTRFESAIIMQVVF
jgi:DNA-binding MarR family transcriptional regulator